MRTVRKAASPKPQFTSVALQKPVGLAYAANIARVMMARQALGMDDCAT